MNYTLFVIMIVSLLINVSVNAANDYDKNLIYIVFESTGRSTLYDLINKQKLPHIQTIIQRGNYRNLEVQNVDINYNDTYLTLFTGLDDSQLALTSANYTADVSIVNTIKNAKPELESIILFTPRDQPELDSVWMQFMESVVFLLNNKSRIKPMASYYLGLESASVIKETTTPFLLFLNFTHIDRMGRRYREGGELYSKALLNADRAIGIIIKALKKKGVYEQTEFLFTSNVGMRRATRESSEYTWVISSQKVQRKGVIQDIVPSVYDLLDLKIEDQSGTGRSLFETP